MRQMLLLLVALAVPWLPSAAGSPCPPRGSSSSPADQRPRTRGRQPQSDYAGLIDEYLHGDPDGAVDELLGWTEARVRDQTAWIGEVRAGGGWSPAMLKASIMLHTEAFLRGGSIDLHFPLTRQQIARQEPPFRAVWRVAAASFLLSRGNFAEARAIVTADLEDPVVLLAAGSIEEAAGRLAASRDGPDSFTRRWGPSIRQEDAVVRMLDAERKYRAVLARDPTLVEASLRLGRVLTLRGSLGDARRPLERALRDAPHSYVTYLAALFLGQLHERDGRFEQALECYRTATHEYPESQTAYLALGHLLEAQGRSDEGWPVVRGIFGSARDRRNPERDPWWVYGYAQFWQLSDLVERLRGMARR